MADEKPAPKAIFDQAYSAKEEIPCEQCGTIIKITQSYLNETNLSVCPKCGAEYDYIHCQPPFNSPRKDWL